MLGFGKKKVSRIEIVRGDIVTEATDVIVNAAKASLLGGGGVDGAIHRAGGPAILDECRRLRERRFPNGLPVGHAVATTAGKLPARWVVHTVGPRYPAHVHFHADVYAEVAHRSQEAALLRSCYTRSLAVADKLGARSVAFPLISAGAYGWPARGAIAQALTALSSARTKNVELARLVIYDGAQYRYALVALARLEGWTS